MRRSAFGEIYIDSKDDDLADALYDASEGRHAMISKEGDKYAFEIMDDESGEQICASDEIFDSEKEVRDFLDGWVEHSEIST